MISSKSPEVAKLHYKVTEKVKFLRTSENWVFFSINGWVFSKKNPISQKSDKGSDFAVKCHWLSKFSQNVQVLVFEKKSIGLQKKMILFKIVENSKFAVKCDWISDISQHVTKKRDFENKIGYLEKNLEFGWRTLKAANLMQDATELVSFL